MDGMEESEPLYPFALVAEVFGVPLTTARFWFDNGGLGAGHYVGNGRREHAKLFLRPCAAAAMGMLVAFRSGRVGLKLCARACNHLANMDFSEFQRLADEQQIIVANEPLTSDGKPEPIRTIGPNERVDFLPGFHPVMIAPHQIESRVYQALATLNQLTNEKLASDEVLNVE